jgi:hypothetical protein
MPEKAAFFHFYSAFCLIPREISGLARKLTLTLAQEIVAVDAGYAT